MRLIVIGGGAAGFFCAVNAARFNPSLDVMIVEKSNKLLSKVRISGGGRCNVTHACFSLPEMVKKYPRGANFVKKTFHEFFTEDTIAWFMERGVQLKTEADGRMFPITDSSATVITCLLHEADKYGVKIRMQCEVRGISKTAVGLFPENETEPALKKRANWKVEFINGEVVYADFICVASGGYPKESMFGWLKEVGHSVASPVPSLFTFNMPGHPVTKLMGISVEANVKVRGTKFEESGPVLITHWGLSGPAVLKLSARGARELNEFNYRFTAVINWSPGFNEKTAREKLGELKDTHPLQKVFNGNVFGIPQRLWEYICNISDIDVAVKWSEMSSARLNKLAKGICTDEMKVEGKTTFKEEFVTAGGIKLTEIDPFTMESRISGQLYFAGEILDVDGITGGFNFQHAWTSGWIAAKNIAKAALE